MEIPPGVEQTGCFVAEKNNYRPNNLEIRNFSSHPKI